MGDIAEMMLNGILCEQCGCLIEDYEACGYPRKCDYCKSENEVVNED